MFNYKSCNDVVGGCPDCVTDWRTGKPSAASAGYATTIHVALPSTGIYPTAGTPFPMVCAKCNGTINGIVGETVTHICPVA